MWDVRRVEYVAVEKTCIYQEIRVMHCTGIYYNATYQSFVYSLLLGIILQIILCYSLNPVAFMGWVGL